MKEKIKSFFQKIGSAIKNNRRKIVCTVTVLLLFLIVTFCMELINTSEASLSDSLFSSHNFSERNESLSTFFNITFANTKFLINYLMCLLLFSVFYGIFNRPKVAFIITTAIVIGFEIINYGVIQVRGFALTVADIYAVKTAMSVAGGMSFKIKGDIFIAFILLIITFVLLFLVYKGIKRNKPNILQRILKTVVYIVIGVVGIVLLFTLPILDEMLIWDINSCYADYGSSLTILKMCKDIRVSMPEGYMKEEVEEYIDSFENDTAFLSEEQRDKFPNIVIIMNESFSDLTIPYDIDLEKDCIPYFHELYNDPSVVSGIMHSSKIGGGTSSIEYEFLTQNTTAFLPVGSIPYQQYIRNNVSESIVKRLDRLGYTTHGMHSYHNTGYSRGKVYKLLGFDDIKFMSDMPDLVYTHNNYPTDSSTYKYLYETIPQEEDDQRDFTFVLTMQNHIAYANDETGEKYYPSDYFTNIFMQEEKMSDDALRECIDYFSNVEEDTVILFFGDHQPSLNQNELFTIKDGVDEKEANYIVPFIIWANFDLNVQKNIETSTNYLQSILYEACNMPTDSYTKYINELRKEIPVITCNYYKGADGNRYLLNDVDSPYYGALTRYNQICYYHLFDK